MGNNILHWTFIVILYILSTYIGLISLLDKRLEGSVTAGALFISAAILHAKERGNKSKE